MHLHVASPIYLIQFYFIFVLVSIFLVNKLKVVLSTRVSIKFRLFIAVIFYIFDLHIYVVDFIQKNYRILFHTIKCKYISLDVGIELSI